MSTLHSSSLTAIVAGGGVVGLSVAREFSQRGVRVTLLERGRLLRVRGSASRAALGVLNLPRARGAPFSELCRLGHRTYPALVQSLRTETGRDVGFRICGGLHLVHEVLDPSRREKMARPFRRGDFVTSWLSSAELRERVPLVAGHCRGALWVPEEAVVKPTALMEALAESCRRRGVIVRDCVGEVKLRAGASPSVLLGDGGELHADRIVVAAGAWCDQLIPSISEQRPFESQGRSESESPGSPCPVVPVRGQGMEFRCALPAGPTLHFRSRSSGRRHYIVAAGDGRAAIGSTSDTPGFDSRCTADAEEELLKATQEVLPEVRRQDIVRLWAGLRPQARRLGGPFLGRLPGLEDVWIATGHYRSGILAGPASAALLVRSILACGDLTAIEERVLSGLAPGADPLARF